MKTRRPRRNGLDRLVRALRQVSRYSLSGALVALAGCVPTPNLIGVSPDGRYVVVPVNQMGVAVAIDDASSIVRLDLKTNDVQVLGPNRNGAFWMNIAGDTVVYGLAKEAPSVVIHHGLNAPAIVDDAVFPTLSADGGSIIYAATRNWDTDFRASEMKLMKRDVKTGNTIDLKLTGTAPEFSPDGKRFLFVSSAKNGGAAVEVADVDGTNRKMISDIQEDLSELFRPRWIDGDRILYRAKANDNGSDAELFIATLDGKTEQVTMNDIEDITPIAAGKDRIIWRELAVGQQLQHNDDALPLWISEKKDGKWTSRALGIKALAVSVVGDDLFYVDAVENEGIALMRAPIKDPTKGVNVGTLIKQKVNNLPASRLNK